MSAFGLKKKHTPTPTHTRAHTRARTMSFAAAVQKLLAGATSAQDFARLLAGEVVEDLLRRVAADYALDYAALVETYKAAVVDSASSFASTTGGNCTFALKTSGQACGRKAAIGSFCATHAPAGAADVSKRRRLDATKSALKAAAGTAGNKAAAVPLKLVPANDPLSLL